MNYKPVIGLEVHVELKTKSKMFCGCSSDYFGKKPNTHTCPVCLGLPGALPVPNKKAIDWCVMIGIALNCKIANFSKFDRKNYFYPDLPKGYQISQYDQPFCQKGFVVLSNGKKIGITRVHMEEDTAKLTHQDEDSLIDFNRSGVPLVEIVTEPDFETAKEVVEYLKKLQQIVRYLGVSNADMEEGNMRLEPNISLRKGDIKELPKYKVEVKNINSFRFVEKAIEYEIKRQAEILNEKKIPVQETRGWNEGKQKTVSQRIKEESNDYRYFPEPDIPPIRLTEVQVSNLRSQIPELPDARLARFIKEFNLSPYDAEILTREKEMADYFEESLKVGNLHGINPKQIANTVINKKVDIDNILPAELVKNIVNFKKTDDIDDNELRKIINKIIKENQKAVNDYKSGKENAIMFLIGQVLKRAKQKLNTTVIKNVLITKLK
ncbi:MAG: Asp-tRNA(Asn)/Glu-tRNA(Gln) amidotransferase subunit GatB [Candidatus Levybacteria bacterium]|nr:Asp-tRNA(Asn)/Glu-tRNA(Gln) amidotransferase subunit GatB [Candidatus Levybacteria bacterium]MDZ4227965.1 Asp-tRNA(Asn)/Glu-tRNA(Gln) amidotransferase subunit GatB [Candidatus Levybacteria bacterium]